MKQKRNKNKTLQDYLNRCTGWKHLLKVDKHETGKMLQLWTLQQIWICFSNCKYLSFYMFKYVLHSQKMIIPKCIFLTLIRSYGYTFWLKILWLIFPRINILSKITYVALKKLIIGWFDRNVVNCLWKISE